LNRQMRIAEAMNAVMNDACRRQCRRRQIAGPAPLSRGHACTDLYHDDSVRWAIHGPSH
jgi:hypothetical protein